MVEVMVAMVIFSLAVMAIYSLQVFTIGSITDARQQSEAMTLAQNVLEEFRAQSSTWTTAPLPSFALAGPNQWLPMFEGKPVNGDGLTEDDIRDPKARPPIYCLKYRVAPLGGVGSDTARVEVRVMWPKPVSGADEFADCPADMDGPDDLSRVWQMTFSSTVFRHRS